MLGPQSLNAQLVVGAAIQPRTAHLHFYLFLLCSLVLGAVLHGSTVIQHQSSDNQIRFARYAICQLEKNYDVV